MNIEKKQIDDLNIKLTLNIAADDYAPIKKKKLNERRRTAEFKGFRKGMVPASLIERVYGEQCLGDAVNDIISEQLGKYMEESGLNFIGEPLTSEDQPEIEWKDGNDFTFMFDLAVAPKIDFELSSSDKVVNYTIKSTAVAKEEMKRNMLMQYGEMQEVEAPTPESYLYVDLENDDKTVENGYISMRDVTEAMKPALMGVKAGDKLELNINEVLKEDLAGINPVFNATVVNIKNFEAAKPTPETFDRIFGEGNVKTEEDFEKEVANRLAENYRQESDYRLGKDIKDYLVKKADIKLPEDFLKRWLYTINKEKYTMEDIEKEFDSFLADYKWQLVSDYLMKKFDLKIDRNDLSEAAHGYVSYQYAMYGMANVPSNFIDEAAQKMLNDRQQVERLSEQVAEQKVIAAVKDIISFDKKSISVEKFRELK